jgi:Uma2 family endonuclease
MGAEVHFLLAAGRLLGTTSNQARHGDMTATQLVTADELLQMGSDAPYELWEGVLKAVSPSSSRSSEIGALLTILVGSYVLEHGLGHMTNADGGYILSSNPYTVVSPDVGFHRGEHSRDRGFYPLPPDFAVEVISPTDRKADIVEKQTLYTRAGVPLVWWVDPERKTVTVYRLGHALEVIEANGVLDGGDVLPGFTLELQAIFRD